MRQVACKYFLCWLILLRSTELFPEICNKQLKLVIILNAKDRLTAVLQACPRPSCKRPPMDLQKLYKERSGTFLMLAMILPLHARTMSLKRVRLACFLASSKPRAQKIP